MRSEDGRCARIPPRANHRQVVEVALPCRYDTIFEPSSQICCAAAGRNLFNTAHLKDAARNPQLAERYEQFYRRAPHGETRRNDGEVPCGIHSATVRTRQSVCWRPTKRANLYEKLNF